MSQDNQTHTTTGEKDLMPVHENERVTVLVHITGTATYDLDLRAYSTSTKRVAPTQYSGLNVSDVYVIDGPITGVGINITAISGTVEFEVVNARMT